MRSEGWTVPRLWDDATVAIVDGGPSLTLRHVHRLAIAHGDGRIKVIAINDAVFPCWWADWLHACDPKWWEWHRNHGIDRFPGIRTTNVQNAICAVWGVHLVRTDGVGGFSDDPARVKTGKNGAYIAVQMAVHAGAKRILLLGVDMKPGAPGEMHWFGLHPDGDRHMPDFAGMRETWKTLVEPLKSRGVEVVNCSPDSALDCFPKARLEDVI